jgi:heptaprenyl diphosphate synthase
VATDEEFSDAIRKLREHPVTEATMDKARAMAQEAIAELSHAPDDVVRSGLVRFAEKIVDRSY